MMWLRLTLVLTATLTTSLFAQDISVDKKLGAENALLVEREIGLYQHDSLYNLVNEVGHKLVSRLTNNPFEFKFFLADSEVPNAFALPGGYVYLTRGILLLIQTEDELAGIMAHEITHVTERHSIKQMKKGRIGGILQVPGNIINAVTGTRIGNIINTPLAWGSQAFISSYSRGREKDADSYGARLAVSAGYNPNALADALERLAKGIEIVTGEKEKKNYFSDHPMTSSRTAEIRKSNTDYKPLESSTGGSKEEFQQKFNGLCFGPNPKQGIFIDSLFIHPELNFSWIAPRGWQSANKPTAVGVFAEQGDALAVLNIVDTKKSVREIGEDVKSRALRSTSVIVQSAKDTVVNSNKAYLIRLIEVGQGTDVFLDIIWVSLDEKIFQLAGVSTPPKRKVVNQTLYTFRKSTKDELNMINQLELQIVHSEKSETISQLSERTGNKLSVPLTALINDLSQDSSINENIGIKIIRAVPYVQ